MPLRGGVGTHGGHRGRTDDLAAHGSDPNTSLDDAHVPHAAEAISGYGQTGQYPPPQTCPESYSATEILLYSAPPLLGVKPGSASNLGQLLTGKVESTLLSGPQLLGFGSVLGIPEPEVEKVGVGWTQEHVDERDRRVHAVVSPAECAQPDWPSEPIPRPGPRAFLQL